MLEKNKKQEPNTEEEGFLDEEEFESEAPKKIRVREVDFMRLEATVHGQTLSPFELEVREKFASVESPPDVLIRREERRKLVQRARRKIAKLFAKAELTKRQKEAFWLFFLDGFPASEVARRLGVTKQRALSLKWILEEKIQKALQEGL